MDENQTSAPLGGGCKIELADVIKAFSQEISSLRRELYGLSSRILRYDRIFETAFKEELDRRVNGKGDCCNEAGCASPLSQLERKLTQGAR